MSAPQRSHRRMTQLPLRDLCLILAILGSCVSHLESSQDLPVVTRITEPVAHGEGPHWDPKQNVLYYVDIAGQALHRYDPATNTDIALTLDKTVSLVIPIKGEDHKFVVGIGRDLVLLTWDWDSGIHNITTLASVDNHEPDNRLNDGKADALGRLWAGTMGPEPGGNVVPNKGTLYRLDNGPGKLCAADVEVQPVSISNGLAWSLDNKVLYYIDTPTRRVDAFDYNLDNGTISNRTTVFKFGELHGSPDGMTIDSEGNLWIACWGGSQVIKVNPASGKLLQAVTLPVSRVTSVSWGGPLRDTLYVTSMRVGLTQAQLQQEPYAGSVWRITNLHTTGPGQHPAVVNCHPGPLNS